MGVYPLPVLHYVRVNSGQDATLAVIYLPVQWQKNTHDSCSTRVRLNSQQRATGVAGAVRPFYVPTGGTKQVLRQVVTAGDPPLFGPAFDLELGRVVLKNRAPARRQVQVAPVAAAWSRGQVDRLDRNGPVEF